MLIGSFMIIKEYNTAVSDPYDVAMMFFALISTFYWIYKGFTSLINVIDEREEERRRWQPTHFDSARKRHTKKRHLNPDEQINTVYDEAYYSRYQPKPDRTITKLESKLSIRTDIEILNKENSHDIHSSEIPTMPTNNGN